MVIGSISGIRWVYQLTPVATRTILTMLFDESGSLFSETAQRGINLEDLKIREELSLLGNPLACLFQELITALVLGR
jgi:hypothetical protein